MSSNRPPPRHHHRQRKQQQRHEDTVVAYHNYLQTLIKERLNAINLGPGKTPCLIAIGLYCLGLAFMTVGILLIALRPRHLYLTGVWPRFLGPFFIILFVLIFGLATSYLAKAKRKSNKYRRDLRFQPLGQFGVKVVHTTRLPHEKIMREEYRTGTLPHATAKAPRQTRGYGPRYGQSNRGYLPDNGQYRREPGPAQGHQYARQQQQRPPPGYTREPTGYTSGPPDVVPGHPRQYKSRVVIQPQHQGPRLPPDDDSSV